MIVILLPASETQPTLQPAAVSALARLGVTNVALVRDEQILGLVVDGWAFDPGRSADAVVAVVAGRGSPARTLHPLLHMAVSTAPEGEGGER